MSRPAQASRPRSTRIVQILIGLVFVSAGVYRIFQYDHAREELARLHLPSALIVPIIVFEIACGTLLIIDRWARAALQAVLVFLGLAVVLALVTHPEVLANLKELFVFDPTPTDILLHLMYIVVILMLLRWQEGTSGS